MGKGDKKTKKGKISKGSYGVRRPRSKNNATPAPTEKPVKKEAAKAKPEQAKSTTSKSKTTATKKKAAK